MEGYSDIPVKAKNCHNKIGRINYKCKSLKKFQFLNAILSLIKE